ncbi:hypothetical protein CRI94_10765 [Longibacter salinarum]|uniref:asparagine synthase (glutamine-hydrolyzing) n=1 Tax=Longibacter salinarum TaxID=1850348 RepID=A0A2A8CWX5_9BACT|nr:asparagine synthase-related protein [Longibacter salinarum]PEN13123.1 hypothetical protein CRI94_10765 [Longibacter salinarum]
MGGLCACIHFDRRPGAPDAAQAMVSALAHRGPDGVQASMDADAALVQFDLHVTHADHATKERRIRKHGDASRRGGLIVVADARIDNREDLEHILANDLRPDASDTDLIAAAFRRWGTACLEHLIGDFAFAVWDPARRRLFAARDPMAMRGLYYRQDGDRLLLASEVGAITAVPGVSSDLHEPAIAAYLAGDFEHPSHTFIEGIHAVPPAHALIASPGSSAVRRVWDIDPGQRIRYRRDEEYVEHFRELFAEAVRCRLQTPDPVGLLLSGGVDSTAIAVTAGWLDEQGVSVAPLRTYSFDFPTLPVCDERFVSDEIVCRYGFSSTLIDVDSVPLVRRDPEPNLEEPYVSGFHHLLLRGYELAARDSCCTLMSGHHGDLMVGGRLFDYLGLLGSGQWYRLVSELLQHAERENRPLRDVVREQVIGPLRVRVGRWLRASGLRSPEDSPVPRVDCPPWATDALRHYPAPSGSSSHIPIGLSGVRRERYELATLGGHMRGGTRNNFDAVREGLASADPWSDRRLFEWVMAVPPSVICRGGENKSVARAAFEEMMPGVRAQKIYPEALFLRALRMTEKEHVAALLKGPRLRDLGFIDVHRLRAYYDEFREGRQNDHRFWYTLVLERWLRQHCAHASDDKSRPSFSHRHTTTL